MEEYKKRIKRQNQLLWIGVVLLVAMDVVLGIFWNDLGFLDSRQMTGRAENMQRLLVYGTLIYCIVRLVMNRKKLKNPFQLEEESRWQKDERRGRSLRWSYPRTARPAVAAALVGLAVAVFVTSLYNMDMFNALYWTLLGAIAVRAVVWLYYNRKY